MKTAHLTLIFGFLLTSAPAFASVSPAHNPTGERKPTSSEVAVEAVANKPQSSLPLECRGYYVRQITRTASPHLTRCE
jgi:hypothetical protein